MLSSLSLCGCCFCQVGWFPTYTITEDYALSMELKKAGCKGRYLPLNLVVRQHCVFRLGQLA